MKNENIPAIHEKVGGLKKNFYALSFYSLPKQKLKFLHYHDCIEFGLCLEGSGVCFTDKGEMHYEAGDVQLILPFQPHYNITDNDNTKWMFISIDLRKLTSEHVKLEHSFFLEMAQRIDVSGVITEKANGDTHCRIKDMASLFNSDMLGKTIFFDVLTLKLAELIVYLSHNKANSVEDYRVYKKNASILPSMNYVSLSIDRGEKPKVPEMAAACFMSESYFRKVFLSVMGESPKSYIMRMQIQKAADLLAITDFPLTEISLQCGFEDNSTFYRCFMRIYGISPGEYRKKCRQD